jgi:saccharopine dehydrogenase-like NADP-dependent oxidoreductase
MQQEGSYLVLGASGATGRFVVRSLLLKNKKVVVLVRNAASFANLVPNEDNLIVHETTVLDMDETELKKLLGESKVVFSFFLVFVCFFPTSSLLRPFSRASDTTSAFQGFFNPACW